MKFPVRVPPQAGTAPESPHHPASVKRVLGAGSFPAKDPSSPGSRSSQGRLPAPEDRARLRDGAMKGAP
jgi:hypothetical protein